MNEKARKWNIKVVAGLVLTFGFLIFNYVLFTQNAKLGIFLFVGLAFGYLLTRSRIGFSTIYVGFFNTGNSSRFHYLLMLFAISVIGTAVIHFLAFSKGAVPQFQATGSETIIPGTSAVAPVDIGLLIGAFLFGCGMVINKGCGSGTLRNMGNGNARYILTFLFILIGTIPGQLAKHAFSQSSLSQYSIQMYLPEQFGYAGTVIFILLLFLVFAVLAKKYESKRKKAGTYQTEEESGETLRRLKEKTETNNQGLFHRLFQAKLPAIIGVLGIAALLFLSLVATGETLKVTRPFIKPAVALFSSLGFSFDMPAFEGTRSALQNGIWNDADTLRNAGIVIGALLYNLTADTFLVSWDVDLKETGWYMLSGLMMGFGAVLANGCNIGALYSGIVNFSLSGWAVLLFMGIGAILTMNVMNGKVSMIKKGG